MGFNVCIQRTADGAQGVYHDDDEWTEIDGYRWAEGNQSCDCNRARYFARARGEEEPEHPECGDGGRFIVLWIKDDQGHYIPGWEEPAEGVE